MSDDALNANQAGAQVDGVVQQIVPGGIGGNLFGDFGVPLVNINAATQAQLEELPGVGPVTAQAILQWRTDNGPFTAVDELLEVSGIGDATLAEIAPFVTL